MYYWSSTRNADYAAGSVYATSSAINLWRFNARARWFNVRWFKDKPMIPDSNWETLYDWSSVSEWAGIFHNITLWLISVSWDGINWTTIADKNIWASTVYNNWDTVTDSNCGGYFQWGNNYMFPFSWSVTTSSTKVDATGYWPWNYYSSDVFITPSESPLRRENPENKNLRWWETWVVTLNNAINNKWVLSVNGQTWDVTIPTAEESNTKTFYLSSTSDLTNAQAAYDWWAAGKNPIIIYSQVSYSVVSDSISSGVKKLSFVRNNPELYVGSSSSYYRDYLIQFTINQTTLEVESITATGTTEISWKTYDISVLETNKNYSTPYTPQYNWSPATKKYVDDSVSWAVSKWTTAPSSPVEWQLRYDTTNDVLKVYNWTTWVEVWWWITNDTTWTTSTISQEWVWTKAEFEALSSYWDKIYNIIE